MQLLTQLKKSRYINLIITDVSIIKLTVPPRFSDNTSSDIQIELVLFMNRIVIQNSAKFTTVANVDNVS